MKDSINIFPHPLVFKMPHGAVTYFFDPDGLSMTQSQLENFRLMVASCETNPEMIDVINNILVHM